MFLFFSRVCYKFWCWMLFWRYNFAIVVWESSLFLASKYNISLSAATRQPAISALPFFISCFVVSLFGFFYLARLIHSPNPFLSLRRLPHGAARRRTWSRWARVSPLLQRRHRRRKLRGLFFKLTDGEVWRKTKWKIQKCFIDSDPLLLQVVETTAVVSSPPERGPSF